MSTKRHWYLSVLLALTVLVSACGGGSATTAAPEATSAPPATEGPALVRIGWAGSPDTLNPGAGVLVEAYTIYSLVYDTLYEFQLDGTYKLDVAESASVSDDGLTWTYKIRSGINFHDGQPMTAKDAAFSINLYKSHEDFPYLNSYTFNFETVEAPDDSTVVITLTEPVPNIDYLVSYLYILPEHIWKDHTEGAAAAEFENVEMIGTGPFKMVEYKQNEFVHLAANTDHFQNPPKIDEVVFQTFDNQDALVQAVKTGQVDMITEMPNTAAVGLRNEPNVKLVTGAPYSPEVTDVIFNQVAPENCPTDDGGVCTGHPALLDRDVRLALAHATDKKKIIDVVLLGLGDPGLTLIPIGLGRWYNNSLTDYEHDVAKANQLLDDGGYKDADGDGVREMPDGTDPLVLRMNWPSDSTTAPRMAELLSEMWSQAGVKTELQAMDPDALTAVCCPAFDFDVMLWGWGSDPDPNLLSGVMTTEQIPTGSSETGYSNPEYDELYAQQAVELDSKKRQEIVWEMQRIVHEDVVYVIPFYAQEVQAYRTDRFTGWLTDAAKLALEDVSSLIVIEPVR
jgi:peptide/nickel transport system substrate-binding protein